MRVTSYTVQERERFRFVDHGPSTNRPAVVLLHGMLGALENWTATIDALASAGRRVIAPILPVYDLPLSETSVSGLVRYTVGLTMSLQLDQPVLIGNSLGGQVALLYALEFRGEEKQPSALILTGASGVQEIVMGESTPRRFDRDYVKERAAYTFHDPRHASDELVDGVMQIVADRNRVIRLIKMARSSRDETVEELLTNIPTPTLLIWGTEDRLTPPDVARRFEDRLANARLELIPSCGHAPMIEHPETFNRLVIDFLDDLEEKPQR
ncbi:MAG TPA: alpha/beta hydrolase [Rhodothermia bacterium]|nr:alpha/beta hydrolase [Rhodothermia bacterium]